MRHEWTRISVDGFASDEVDFAARLAASPQSVRDDFDTNVMSPLVNGVDGVILTIAGHADRLDTGEDHRTCLQREGQVSYERAVSADKAVFAMLGDWLTPAPATWDELPQIAAYLLGRGALGLISEGESEDERRRNRRVEFQICRFITDG